MDRDFWPFCSYSLYSRVPQSNIAVTLKVKLLFEDNTEMMLSPTQALPIDFIKSFTIFNNVFYSNDENKKSRMISLIRKFLEKPNYDWSNPYKVYNIGKARINKISIVQEKVNYIEKAKNLNSSEYKVIYE